MERYFRLAARGTLAEGAELRFSREPAKASCASCGGNFIPSLGERERILCPSCGSDDCELIGGLEYRLERLEVL